MDAGLQRGRGNGARIIAHDSKFTVGRRWQAPVRPWFRPLSSDSANAQNPLAEC
jgi:hypothetical protein